MALRWLSSSPLVLSLPVTIPSSWYLLDPRAASVILLLQCAASLHYFVVVQNPLVAELIALGGGPSSAARTCRVPANAAAACATDVAAGFDAPVDAGAYYEEYHSHRVAHLSQVRARLASQARCRAFIYLAGDSSLDNKHWFFKGFKDKRMQMMDAKFTAPAVNGYEHVLAPSRMVQDVSYWLNQGCSERLGAGQLCTLMTSIEESTVDDRSDGLLAQDAFIRDHISEDDFLIVSVGGNDIALRPRLRTAVNMLLLTRSPDVLISAGYAPGFGYFVDFFHRRVQKYVCQLVAKRKPKKILVCMIYYLDEVAGGSWADHTLKALGYDANPGKLQLIIRTIFEAVKQRGFHIPGVQEVVPFPLFRVLDGKTRADYVQRVEPSVAGGQKMAKAFLDELLQPSSL